MTDTMFSGEAALGSNMTAVETFVGCNSKYIDVYGVATDHDTDDQSRATKQEQANLCAVTVLCAST